MTTAPNGTITDYPFPGYEVENPTGTPTVRITFSIAGQAVALKVMGSSTSSYYLYNDHLGSTTTMSTTGGGTVAGSTARYTPFGDWRTEPTASDPNGSPLTDRGFTGHMHNNLGSAPDDMGLIYMNACLSLKISLSSVAQLRTQMGGILNCLIVYIFLSSDGKSAGR